jgi:hypothetical protein
MSPTINGKPDAFGNFDLVKRVELDYTDVAVSKWQSRVTGLSVVHLDFEGAHNRQLLTVTLSDSFNVAPLVNGYFVVGTESMLKHFLALQYTDRISFRRQRVSSHARAVRSSFHITAHMYSHHNT